MAFPTGRLQTRAERALIGAAYFGVTVLQVPSLLFEDDSRSLFVVEPDQGLSDALDAVQYLFSVAVIVPSVYLVARRWRGAPAAQRRVLAPVLWTGGAAFAVFLVAKGWDATGTRVDALEQLAVALLATVPFGFLAGLLRSRLAEGAAVSGLVRRLGQTPEPDALRVALAEALGDPTLTLSYWLPDSERFVDAEGRTVTLDDRAWTEVELNGRRIGAIAHDPALADEPELVRTAGAAAALALENQRLSAELRARIEELRASRARLVEAGDAERRRLERNLHDGAQSRLVALAMKLRLARGRAEGQPELAGAARRVERGAAGEPERAARARPRHPPRRAQRPRPRPGARDAGEPRAGAGRAGRRRRRRPTAPGGDRDLLRGLRGAHQRRQVRTGRARCRDRRAHRGPGGRGGGRRRRRRRRPRPRAPGCAGYRTAWPPWTAVSCWTARPRAVRGCVPSSRCRGSLF